MTRASRVRAALFVATIATLLLWQLPFDGLIGWPLALLSTLCHECGHAIVAALAGSSETHVTVFSNGSGVANNRAPEWAWAYVSMGGLLGPPIAAALLFVIGRYAFASRVALAVFGALLALLAATWAQGTFTVVLAGGWALVFVVLAAAVSSRWTQFAVVFLAVQLALSSWNGKGYLFAREATTGAGTFPSDVANIATALGGVWFAWGALLAFASLVVVAFGVWFFARGIAGAPVRAQETA